MPVRTLELRFHTPESRLVTIRVPNPREDLNVEEISGVMDTLMETPVFTGNAAYLATKVNARIVSRAIEEFNVN